MLESFLLYKLSWSRNVANSHSLSTRLLGLFAISYQKVFVLLSAPTFRFSAADVDVCECLAKKSVGMCDCMLVCIRLRQTGADIR